MDELTDEEIDSWLLGVDPFIWCYDLPLDCCSDCHDLEDQGCTGLSVTENFGGAQLTTHLCCRNRKYWIGLSDADKCGLLSKVEEDPERIEYTGLDTKLVQAIMLAIEDAVELHEDYSHALKNLAIPSYPKEEVGEYVYMLARAGLIDAENVSTGDSFAWCPKQLTLRGWQLLEAARDSDLWTAIVHRSEKALGRGVSLNALFNFARAEVKNRAQPGQT